MLPVLTKIYNIKSDLNHYYIQCDKEFDILRNIKSYRFSVCKYTNDYSIETCEELIFGKRLDVASIFVKVRVDFNRITVLLETGLTLLQKRSCSSILEDTGGV